MIKGSCCCGAVRFELKAPPKMLGMCHCSRCRKVGASALAFVEKSAFTLLAGEEYIQRWAPEPPFKYTRTFCRRCGTALGEIGSDGASFPIPANCLDDDPGLKVQFHVFAGSKPAWYEICDGAKQFRENPG